MSDEPAELEAAESPPTIDTAMLQIVMQRMRDEQNLGAGILAGLVAAVLGGVIWAVTVVATGYQIGWMAVGVGFLVGYAVRAAGKGIDQSFGLAGAALALFGCLLGNLLIVCYFISDNEGIPMMDLLPQLDLEIISELMIETFAPMDLLFYGIAVYEGFKLSTREVTEEDLQAATTAPVLG